jgi:hypothetical protein
MNFHDRIKSDSMFTGAQQVIIYKSIEQLYAILRQIVKTSDPIHGTLTAFENEVKDWGCSAHHK